ncbi:MAG: DUF4911 domain-containing protein [Mariprofundaceae bacterium]
MQSSDVLIVEVCLPARQVVFFQGLLQGEDGLAVMRCFDAQHVKQQLWTTVAQREALMAWLATLPERIGLEVLDEWIWQAGDRRTT